MLADLPGLIEGAHEGVGLGDHFLGHTERCRVLLHLVDGTSEDAGAAYKTVRTELEAYGNGLAGKPEIVALTKADALTPEAIKTQSAKLKKACKKMPVVLFVGLRRGRQGCFCARCGNSSTRRATTPESRNRNRNQKKKPGSRKRSRKDLMKTRAAVAWKAGEPLTIETIDIEGPKAGEVLVEIKATGVCHTDAYTLSGADPEGIFPAILGHEGAGIVREVGAGVTTRESRRPRHPALHAGMPAMQNLPVAPLQPVHRDPRHAGPRPDAGRHQRVFACDGDAVFHYMGCSTFANFTVLPEIALAKVREDAPFDKICYIGCGVTTGIGAVINTAKVWPGANVAVFGLGGIGLNVDPGRAHGRRRQDHRHRPQSGARAPWPKKFGMTHFVNPDEVGRDKVVQAVVDLTGGGADFSFECIGNVNVMRQALECCHRGWGESIIIGVAGVRPGDRHAAVPAGHRPGLEGHGFRRRARPHRRAQDRRLVHGGQDQYRRPDHPHHAAGQDQRRLRPDARRQVDPQRGDLLIHFSHSRRGPSSGW